MIEVRISFWLCRGLREICGKRVGVRWVQGGFGLGIARGSVGYLLYVMKVQLWSIRGGDQTCTDRLRRKSKVTHSKFVGKA